MHRDHANETTPMVYADDETFAMISKYQLAQSYMLRRLVMQTNIPSNLQANIEQIRPAPDKKLIKYYIEAITFNLSNKENRL